MARLTIPDEQTFAEFTVVTSTSVFPITFSLFAKADLTVLVDGGALDQSAFSFSGTVLDGGGYDGGTVTLNAAVDDVEVRIERNVAPSRTSNFAPAGTTPVGSVDQALNRLTAVQQDAERRKADLPAGALAGKFFAFDAAGLPVAASGTGSDAALRTDMVANSGFTLIKHKRAESGTYARTASQMNRIGAMDSAGVSLMHWLPSDYDESILSASNGDMLNAYVQAAFDNVRADVPLNFPPNGELRTSASITNPRAIPIVGNNCQWRGFFGADVSSDLLLVEPVLDRRLFFIRGLKASFSTGGRHVVHLTSDGLPGAILSFDLSNNGFSTIGDGVGAADYAVRLDGLGTHIGVVSKNDIAGGIHATTADRVIYDSNLMYGHRGMLLSLVSGAYTTVIQNNAIVTKQGVTITKGDNFHFVRNQIEQGYGANNSAFESQLTVYGEAGSPILNFVAEGNNFGGGADCASPVTFVAHAERARFKDNQYGPSASSYDVRVLSSSVKYCSFDEQFTRGAGRDTSEPFSIYDLGTATRGVWRTAKPAGVSGSEGDQVTFSNGWTATASFGMSVAVSDSVALLSGGLVVGSAATTSDKIATFPEGYRPRADTILLCTNNVDNNISRLKLEADGDLYPAGTMPAAGSILYLPASYRTKVAASVATGVT